MHTEELDWLMSIDSEVRKDAEAILFALEHEPDGLNTTTHILADTWLADGCERPFSYLFALHDALMLLAETHGLKLDMSRHDCMCEGLPFNLDYSVWHRRDAAANGMFDDEASPARRDWHDANDEEIADAMASVLSEALPAHVIPSRIRYRSARLPVLDTTFLEVMCQFDSAGLSFSLSFTIQVSSHSALRPVDPVREPQAYDVRLTCMGTDEDFEASWDPEARTWSAPLPLER